MAERWGEILWALQTVLAVACLVLLVRVYVRHKREAEKSRREVKEYMLDNRVCDLLARIPSSHSEDLAYILGVSPVEASDSVRRLVAAGRVEATKEVRDDG